MVSAAEAEFTAAVAPFHREVTAHCYRMLGSLTDAEDVVQETWMRAWQAWPGFRPRSDDRGRSVRAWLYKIATNRCLTFLGRAARRELPTTAEAQEVRWLEPLPDDRMAYADQLDPAERLVAWESVELAFLVALQHLPPRQRAALLLREVLGYSAVETADLLDTSVASVNSALQRARVVRERPVPDRSAPETADLARRYAAAWEAGDVEAIVAMLAEDARFSMPPLPEWYAGRAAIREFLVTGPLTYRWRFLPARANGMPAFATYHWDGTAYTPMGLDVLTIRDGAVREVVSFLQADVADFGLPSRIEGER
ncbi:RNA polymerase subunit sigma-70 [Pseudonocardia adelaidensis]|uniref:Sigma-70 family RNA polymerase sigma factor n=1 Tax=Pseudonocardia adelaidensis TaxID=648754 RepID=A0ABP9NL54_9PSEU